MFLLRAKNSLRLPKFVLILFLLLTAFLFIFFIYKISQKQNYQYSNVKANHTETISPEFAEFLQQKKLLTQKKDEVVLIAVGDISYSRGVERIIKTKNDLNYPFSQIQNFINKADVVFGNLETPITAGEEIPDFSMTFRSNPSTAQALQQAGFSILSLANNHTPNFGDVGLKDTFAYLKSHGIKYIGAGQSSKEANAYNVYEKNNIKIAFLAYTDPSLVPNSYEAKDNLPGTAFMRTDKMIEAVKIAKNEADFVVVSMHSGIEYNPKPNEFQKNFAHIAIDNGADLIIGHHPHVIQSIENYKGKYIIYSLGNFVFDQMFSLETRSSLIAKIHFSKDGISNIVLLPVFMSSFAQPALASLSTSEQIFNILDYPAEKKGVFTWSSKEDKLTAHAYTFTLQKNQNENQIFSKSYTADINKNLINEHYILSNGKLSVSENNTILWQSPDEWWIDNFVVADSTNDGIEDLNLSLWKSGNFGSSKPFWIQKNDPSVKNHFFVFNWIDSKIKIIWGSSNLSVPNCNFKIADIDNDKKNELIVIEGSYSPDGQCVGDFLAIWKWDEWGFYNKWRSQKGEYDNFDISDLGGQKYVFMN